MSKNTGTSELINYFDLGVNGDVGIAGSLDINTIANATTDTDTFLVSDTGIIKYRTGAQLLSDIGAQGLLTNPVTGTGTSGQIAYFSGTSTITSESGLVWDATNNNLSIGGATANSNLTVSGSDNTDIFTVLSGANSRLHVGTVTSPSISTYIRSQNNYALNLGTNNTNYLTILSSGNVGVNTATPATAFEVNGVGLFTGGSLVGNTKNGVYIYDTVIASLAGGNARSLQIQAQTLSIFTGTTYTEKFKIFENGNVVISTSPTDNGAKLQVTNGNGISFSSRSGASNLFTYAAFGRTSDELAIGIAGASDQFFTGSVAGDAVIKALGTNNRILLGYGTSTALTITSSGNVGIGTVSPNSKFEIQGSTSSPQFRISRSEQTNQGLTIQAGGGVTLLDSYDGTDTVFGSYTFNSTKGINTVTRMRIDGSGNVGIGTASPSTILQANFSNSNAYSSGVTGNGLMLYNTSTTNNQYVGLYFLGEPAAGNAGQATIYGITTGSGAMDLAFSTRGSSILSERMRITSSGNVGIGTGFTPSYPLHVYVSVADWGAVVQNLNASSYGMYVRGGATNGSTSAFYVANTASTMLLDIKGSGAATFSSSVTAVTNLRVNSTGATGSAYSAVLINSPVVTWNLVNDDNGGSGDLRFYNDSLASDAIRIKRSNNNVLIGTASDNGSKLYVNGASYLDGYNYASSIQYTRPVSNTVNPAGGNGVLIFSGGQAAMRMDSSYTMNFDMYNSGTQHTALQIRQNGNTVSINSPNNSLPLELKFQNVASGYLGASSSALYAYSTNGGYVLLNSSSAWVPASDIKRKRNFEPYTKGISAILGLQPKLYNMDFQKDGDEKQVGLVAQEVREFIPLAYEENADFIGINYNAIIVTMVKAIQEQQQQIQELKNKLS